MKCQNMMVFECQRMWLHDGFLSAKGWQSKLGEKKAKCWVHMIRTASIGGQTTHACKAKSKWMNTKQYIILCKEQGY